MNTTNLLVDILIIGVQVLLWMAGIIFSFIFPYNSISRLLEESPAVFFTFFIATSYTLGILSDHLFSLFFRIFRTKKEKEAYGGGLIIRILVSNNEAQKYIDNQYTRLRIARATVVNIPLITISACIFILNNDVTSKLSKCSTTISIFFIGALLTVLSIISWKNKKREYFRYVKETEKLLKEPKKV